MAELEAGATFAGYRIDGPAGRGGMGVVYRATHFELKRPVALKLLSPELSGDAGFRERFKRESQLAASIDHPNVIPIYEAGEAEGRLFIAMRYVEGHDLGEEIERNGRLAPDRAAHVARQVAAALDAAHRRGLVHRDVKPANVMLTEDDEAHVYLMDFGLTKSTSAGEGLTKTGQFVGTVAYVAPEQIRGEPADARSDVYALGCLLYHAVAGSTPFERDNQMALIYAHLNDEPTPLAERVPDAPAGLGAVVERALAKDPGDRYASAGELGRAAVAALGGAGVSVASGGRKPDIHSVAAAGGADGSDSWQRRARLALGIGLPALLLVGIAAAVLAATGVFEGDDDGGGGAEAVAGEEEQREIDPRLAASIPVGERPQGIAFDDGSVWVADRDRNLLYRIDAASSELVGEPVEVGAEPLAVAAADGAVWTADAGANTVRRLQARPDLVPAGEVPVGTSPSGISIGRQLVWVANSGDGTVSLVDRAQPSPVGTPVGVGTEPVAVFVGRANVWVTNAGDDTVTMVNPSTREVVGEPVPVGANPRAVVERFGSAWVANAGDGTVSRLDAETGEVIGEPIAVGSNPRGIAAGHGQIWVANTGDGTVSRIDAETGRVVGQALPVGTEPWSVALGAGSVWVTLRGDAAVARIDL